MEDKNTVQLPGSSAWVARFVRLLLNKLIVLSTTKNTINSFLNMYIHHPNWRPHLRREFIQKSFIFNPHTIQVFLL